MCTNKGKYLIILAGPTAVGKTATSVRLAQEFDAEIISCDSRQLYKELSIGTAKPTVEDMDGVTHHMIGCISATQRYTAADYERDVDSLLAEYFLDNNVAIMTGGTGLYIKAVLHGLDDFPSVPNSVLQSLESQVAELGLQSLVEQLQVLDPLTASDIDIKNERRVIRALSVCVASGRPYSSYLRQATKILPYQPILVVLERPREQLYSRINKRVDQMIADGLVKEVEQLLSYREHTALQTVGYSEIFDYLDGTLSLPEAVELIKRNTRRYAKRQMTWFRNQEDFLPWPAEDTAGLITKLHSLVTE